MQAKFAPTLDRLFRHQFVRALTTHFTFQTTKQRTHSHDAMGRGEANLAAGTRAGATLNRTIERGA